MSKIPNGKPIGVKVAVAGGWDPLHDGHLDHIEKAMQLGDHIIAIVDSDENLIKKRGYRNIPCEARMRIITLVLKGLLGEYRCRSFEVIKNIDKDLTSTETLKLVKPDIFAKGGDRTPDTMPEGEIRACAEIGCKIVYGIGDLLNASSKMEIKKKE